MTASDNKGDGTGNGPRLESATPVLRSADYPRSRDFYRDRLGFRLVEEGGSPPRFGIFKRGGSVLFIDSWNGGRDGAAEGWDAYLHVAGLEALLAELQAAGVEIVRPIETTVYGMREFELLDPDGNRICFGEDADK